MSHHRFFAAVLNHSLVPTCGCLAALIGLVVLAPRAFAQFDTDPANNSQSNADTLALPAATALTNAASLAAPDNDVDFFSVPLTKGDILLGMTTPLANLPSDFDVPDTMASVFFGGEPLTFSDDDGSNETPDTGNGRGSLFRLVAPATGNYQIGVTGFEDYELDGNASGDPHTEAGRYMLTVGRFNAEIPGAGLPDIDPENNAIAGAGSIPTASSTARIGVAELLAGDVDFYKLNLRAGQFLSAMTAPLADMPNSFRSPDTQLGIFDANGMPLIVDDDAGDHSESPIHEFLTSDNPYTTDDEGFPELYGSAIRALILQDGVYYLGVTGFEDDEFLGNHSELGRYAMLIGVGNQTPPQTGDFNEDGTVDAADYVFWRQNLGTLYDQADYDDWRTNFGGSAEASGNQTAEAPEPRTLTALAITTFAVFARRKSAF